MKGSRDVSDADAAALAGDDIIEKGMPLIQTTRLIRQHDKNGAFIVNTQSTAGAHNRCLVPFLWHYKGLGTVQLIHNQL